MMRRACILIFLLVCLPGLSDTPSDSLIVSLLRKEGVRFSSGNRLRLLLNGQEKFDDMFATIRGARRTVNLEYFNFRNDSIASALFSILKDKAREGVKVRALFDAFGNSSNNRPLRREHLAPLRQAGVEIYEYDPLRFPWINHVFTRDHRKIVVVDDSVAYTGGMNVADYYIKGKPEFGSWRDIHCRIEGPAVDDLQRIFLRIWNRTTRGPKTDFRPSGATPPPPMAAADRATHPDRPAVDSVTIGIVNREPRATNAIVRHFYCGAFDSARDSIKLINPYLTLTPSIKRAIKRALRRGVKLEIMVSEKSDIPLTPDCVYYNVHKLMKLGATIWIYRPGFHHSKTIMVDGRFTTVGSANLNSRSLRYDFEANAVVIDQRVTRQLEAMFERDKRDCYRLTPELWRTLRTPWQRFRGWFAHLLAPVL